MANNQHGKPEQAFVDAVRDELDRSCDRLDGHTLSRLNSIRHAALEQSGGRHKALLAPFGGLVTACVLLLLVTLYYPGSRQSTAPVPVAPDTGSAIEDLEILTSSDSLEFYEDLEFYQWLVENESSV